MAVIVREGDSLPTLLQRVKRVHKAIAYRSRAGYVVGYCFPDGFRIQLLIRDPDLHPVARYATMTMFRLQVKGETSIGAMWTPREDLLPIATPIGLPSERMVRSVAALKGFSYTVGNAEEESEMMFGPTTTVALSEAGKSVLQHALARYLRYQKRRLVFTHRDEADSRCEPYSIASVLAETNYHLAEVGMSGVGRPVLMFETTKRVMYSPVTPEGEQEKAAAARKGGLPGEELQKHVSDFHAAGLAAGLVTSEAFNPPLAGQQMNLNDLQMDLRGNAAQLYTLGPAADGGNFGQETQQQYHVQFTPVKDKALGSRMEGPAHSFVISLASDDYLESRDPAQRWRVRREWERARSGGSAENLPPEMRPEEGNVF
jgi:hypothetical protein